MVRSKNVHNENKDEASHQPSGRDLRRGRVLCIGWIAPPPPLLISKSRNLRKLKQILNITAELKTNTSDRYSATDEIRYC